MSLAVLIIFSGVSTIEAQGRESSARFWIDGGAQAPVRPGSHHGRPAAVAPRRAADERRPVAAAVPKPAANTTFVVAVFGDALAVDSARGLADMFRGTADTAVLDRSEADQSLLGGDAAIWRARIDAATAIHDHIDVAVLMIGSAEPDSVPDPHGDPIKPGSVAWTARCTAKAGEIAAMFRDKGIRLIWIGLPPVRDDALAQRFVDLNKIIRDQADKAGATYVDAWEAFTDDNGQYSTMGPDTEGQTVKLRHTDGERFTRAGALKLASFVAADLMRDRQSSDATRSLAAIPVANPALFDEALQVDINAQIRREAGLPAPVAGLSQPVERPGPVLLLGAAPVSPGGRLLSANDSVNSVREPMSDAAPGPVAGRADDFRWPRP